MSERISCNRSEESREADGAVVFFVGFALFFAVAVVLEMDFDKTFLGEEISGTGSAATVLGRPRRFASGGGVSGLGATFLGLPAFLTGSSDSGVDNSGADFVRFRAGLAAGTDLIAGFSSFTGLAALGDAVTDFFADDIFVVGLLGLAGVAATDLTAVAFDRVCGRFSSCSPFNLDLETDTSMPDFDLESLGSDLSALSATAAGTRLVEDFDVVLVVFSAGACTFFEAADFFAVAYALILMLPKMELSGDHGGTRAYREGEKEAATFR